MRIPGPGIPGHRIRQEKPGVVPAVRGRAKQRIHTQNDTLGAEAEAHPNPADPRTDQIPGDIAQGGKVALDWGLHLIDINANMGGLISVVAAQRSKF